MDTLDINLSVRVGIISLCNLKPKSTNVAVDFDASVDDTLYCAVSIIRYKPLNFITLSEITDFYSASVTQHSLLRRARYCLYTSIRPSFTHWHGSKWLQLLSFGLH